MRLYIQHIQKLLVFILSDHLMNVNPVLAPFPGCCGLLIHTHSCSSVCCCDAEQVECCGLIEKCCLCIQEVKLMRVVSEPKQLSQSCGPKCRDCPTYYHPHCVVSQVGLSSGQLMRRTDTDSDGLVTCVLLIFRGTAGALVCWGIFCSPPPHCNPDSLISELPASKGMPCLYLPSVKWASIKRAHVWLWTHRWLSSVLWSGFPCVPPLPHPSTPPLSTSVMVWCSSGLGWRHSGGFEAAIRGLGFPDSPNQVQSPG